MIKPGVKTTEFWLSLIAVVGGFAVAIVQIVAPDRAGQAQTALDEVVRLAALILPLVLSLMVSRDYLVARMSLKTRQSDKEL